MNKTKIADIIYFIVITLVYIFVIGKLLFVDINSDNGEARQVAIVCWILSYFYWGSFCIGIWLAVKLYFKRKE